MRGNANPPASLPLRPDLLEIARLTPANKAVLDLGCGDGDLLAFLATQKGTQGRGIELSEAGALACVRRGLSVRQGKLEEGLADYPDDVFDTVILSQTLPFLDDPLHILQEMLRVGRQAIVSFPNFGYWRNRWGLLWRGRMPAIPDLNNRWHETPRWQGFTINDFRALCRQSAIHTIQEIHLADNKTWSSNLTANFRATTAIFALTNRYSPR